MIISTICIKLGENNKMKIIIKLKDRINNLKIRRKLIFSYVIVVLLPVLIVGIYLTSGMRKMVMDKAVNEAYTNADRIQYRLTEVIKIVNDVSDRIYFNERLRNIVRKQYKSTAEAVNVYNDNPIFDEYMRYYKEIASIRFYVDNETMLDDSQFIKTTEDIRKTSWYKEAIEGSGRITWTYRYDEIVRQNYLSLTRVVRYDNVNRLGVLVININEESLRAIIKDEPFNTILSINNGTVVTSNDKESGKDISSLVSSEQLLSSRKNYKFTQDYKKQKSNIIMNSFAVEKSSSSYFQILTIMPIRQITNNANQISFRAFSIIALSLIIAILLIVIFSKTFSDRIIMLRGVMRRVVSGDFNIEEHIAGEDEIGELYEDLHKMMESIKQLINEVYLEKLQKEQLSNKQREVEFKMLASQINPHFLYNTLETIRMKALISGQKELANTVKMLGKIMRRNLEAGQNLVPLQSEIELMKGYLDIQKLRFGDRINYSIQVLADIEHYEVLPLLLQPIVENAFVHGLEGKEGQGIIDIVINEDEDLLVIDVIDNGLGIDEERLNYVYRKINNLSEGSKKSIGLSNVNQRIRLCYGEGYGIKVTSQKGQGTKVSIYLPMVGGLKYVEGFNS
jgi:two-component system, sensor histidine kinase YesM